MAIGVGGLAVLFAYLNVNDLWYVALGLLLASPMFALIHRRPTLVVASWLILGPLVSVTDIGAIRRLFWVVHRGLPLAGVAAIVVGMLLRVWPRKPWKLGWPEAAMLGYVVATLISIAYTSPEPLPNFYLIYDRVIAPMLIYLILRLSSQSPEEIRQFTPAVIFLLVAQSAIGLASWIAPSTLPGMWLSHVGSRTVGSLGSPSVYGSTVLFAGVFLFARYVIAKDPGDKPIRGFVMLGLALVMVFLTFSRGVWLAGLVALFGLAVVVPRHFVRFVTALALLLAVALPLGLLESQQEWAAERLYSEQAQRSALSRLPVTAASIRMFNERPILGWGYENFDRFDYQFHRTVGNLVAPGKDHASHNLYLTILAEQGLIGFVLYLFPAAYWSVRGLRNLGRMDNDARALAITGLLGITSHIIVNQFSRMTVPFGLGIWWLAVGLVALSVLSVEYRRVGEPPTHRAHA